MKGPIVFAVCLFASIVSEVADAEQWISTSKAEEGVLWGSLSAQSPTAGFYGQRFEFHEETKINAISVFVFDHPDHEEAGAFIEFRVWSFDGEYSETLMTSGPQLIEPHELGGWKTFYLDGDFQLSPSIYLIGVGQSDIGRFVAFGNGLATDDAKGAIWLRTAEQSAPNGWSAWFRPQNPPANSACPDYEDCALMLRVSIGR